jgi:hypothetical protein
MTAPARDAAAMAFTRYVAKENHMLLAERVNVRGEAGVVNGGLASCP